LTAKARHFPFRGPMFGTKAKPKPIGYQTRSVYFWWWEYLRRNDAYARALETGRLGRFATVAQDFGDVRNSTFPEWWKARGVELFAEPEAVTSVTVLNGTDPLPDRSDPDLLIFVIPKNLPKTHIIQRFTALVQKHHKGRAGVKYNVRSRAKYPVQGQPNVHALETALAVFDMRRASPDMPLWEIASVLKLLPKQRLSATDTPSARRDKKNVLAASASRYLKRARLMIDNAGLGVFPKH